MTHTNLPKQAPGVERDVHKRAIALAAAGGNVRPSSWLDILGSVAKAAIPAIAGAL